MNSMEVYNFRSFALISLKASFAQSAEFKSAYEPFLYNWKLTGYISVKKARYIEFWDLVHKFDQKLRISHYFNLLPDYLTIKQSNSQEFDQNDELSFLFLLLKVKQASDKMINMTNVENGCVITEFSRNTFVDKRVNEINGSFSLPNESLLGFQHGWFVPKSKLHELFYILEELEFQAFY